VWQGRKISETRFQHKKKTFFHCGGFAAAVKNIFSFALLAERPNSSKGEQGVRGQNGPAP
jgi:hypothetical protein